MRKDIDDLETELIELRKEINNIPSANKNNDAESLKNVKKKISDSIIEIIKTINSCATEISNRETKVNPLFGKSKTEILLENNIYEHNSDVSSVKFNDFFLLNSIKGEK